MRISIRIYKLTFSPTKETAQAHTENEAVRAELLKQALTPLDQIRTVLVETSRAANLGSSARALKTMGLHDLSFVNPCEYHTDHGKAYALSTGAVDVLRAATRHDDLVDAVQDCRLVIGASARLRNSSIPIVNPKEATQLLYDEAQKGKVALVFGRENSGLNNAELSVCHKLVHIDANPKFSSLNLAMAVQVFAYELRDKALQVYNDMLSGVTFKPVEEKKDDRLATVGEQDFFFNRFEDILEQAGFLYQQDPQIMLQKLKRMFYRTELEHKEVNILLGVLKTIERKFESSN